MSYVPIETLAEQLGMTVEELRQSIEQYTERQEEREEVTP